MEKLTLALTNYNREELLMQSFWNVLNDIRIDEIVISDDCSKPYVWEFIKRNCAEFPKIKLFRNEKNIGMMLNKRRAVELSSNEWVILFDSDNVIDTKYLDALQKVKLSEDVIYCPSGALPTFNYARYAGQTYNSKTSKRYLKEAMFNCLLNTANNVVNRKRYLEVFEDNSEVKGTDTIWFNYLWLKKGNSFYVVPNMKYKHLVHDGSEFKKDIDYNMEKAEETKQLIAAL